MSVIDCCKTLADLLVCLLVADLLTGLVHWLEDAYGHPDWPITGRLVTRPNLLHHSDPRHFTRHSWWVSCRLTGTIALVSMAACTAIGWADWRWWVVASIAANANEIHKWAHRTKRENGPLITFLHATGLLQSQAHHAAHHRRGGTTRYCIVTNLLNPALDRIRLWRRLEQLVALSVGVHRRCDADFESIGHECPVCPLHTPPSR